MTNPNADAQEIMEATGCSFGTARKWRLAWQRENGLVPPKVPKTPNPRPPMRAVRVPVDELPEVKREEVMQRLSYMHSYVDQLQERMLRDMHVMKPNEHVQCANAMRSMIQAAQILCDSYPGLSALFEGDKSNTVESGDQDLAALRLIYGGES